MALFCLNKDLGGKIFSAPCNKTLWELEQTSAVQLRDFGHYRKNCCPFRHENQSLLSETTFALCAGVLPQNTGQRHRSCDSLQAVHLTGCVGRKLRSKVGASALDVEANTFNMVFVFAFVVEFSSDFGFNEVSFIIS